MPWSSLAAIFLSMLLNTTAMVFLKAGARRLGALSFTNDIFHSVQRIAMQPYVCGGIVCYAISLVVWVFVLSRESVSAAYPITAFVYVLNALAASYFFDEMLRPIQWGGMACILMGVVLIARA